MRYTFFDVEFCPLRCAFWCGLLLDIRLLFGYPIYIKLGEGGGGFIMASYKPYGNALTQSETETLCGLYEKAEGKEKEILYRIIRKYGADKLEL